MKKNIGRIFNRIIKISISFFFYSIYKFKRIDSLSALFISHPDFTDNVFPLFLELRKRRFKCTWVLYKKESIERARFYNTDYILFNEINSFKSRLKLAKYHYLFTSHDIPDWFWKKGQIVYNCWHGSPFKKYRGRYLNNFKKQHYLIIPSQYCLNIYDRTYDRKIFIERCLIYRHFRTDYFMKNYGLKEKRDAYDYIALKNYSRMIICCLTWSRDLNYKDSQSINPLGLKLKDEHYIELNNRLKINKTLLLIKPHPAYETVNIKSKYSNIKIITSDELTKNNIQLYAVLSLSDALITDFSSILFDYCLLKKPVGHIMHDLEYYFQNKNEEFVYKNPTKFMYGYKIHNFPELLKFVDLDEKFNNKDCLKISKLYNDDELLKLSSTKKFIKEKIMH